MTQSINNSNTPNVGNLFADAAVRQATPGTGNLFSTMVLAQAGNISHPKPTPNPQKDLEDTINSLNKLVTTISGKLDGLEKKTDVGTGPQLQKTLSEASAKLGMLSPKELGKGQLPDFPNGPNVSKEQKMEFVMKMLQENPNATRDQLEAKYTYTDPNQPGKKTGPLSFAGGGQGNVIFLQGTDVVIKKELIKPEADTYRFFRDFDTFCKDEGKVVPEGLKGFSKEELKKMYDGRDTILKGFPVPISMKDDGKNVIVAVKNSTYDGDVKVGTTVDDIKIGARIVSKNELKSHGNKEGSGLRWLVKVIQTKIFPKMKGTPERGYEFVAQNNSPMVRLQQGRKSDEILTSKFEGMTADQKQSLYSQLHGIKEAHKHLPVTFIGSSIMMSLPDDDTKMPHICMGDFAHAMFTTEVERPGVEAKLTAHTYNKYKQNFDEGIGNFMQLLEKSLEKDGILLL